MLTLRREQLQIFQPVAEKSFLNRLVQYLRTKHGDVVVRLPKEVTTPLKQLPGDVLMGIVDKSIVIARGYGLTWESSLSGFTVLRFEIAPNFDQHPLVKRVLLDQRVPGDCRLEDVWDRTTARTWETIVQRYNPADWERCR